MTKTLEINTLTRDQKALLLAKLMEELKPASKPARKTASKPASKPASEVKLINYTEKSIAVIGDTKPIKDKLKKANGRFNMWLKVNGEVQPGWIFAAKHKAEVTKLIKA